MTNKLSALAGIAVALGLSAGMLPTLTVPAVAEPGMMQQWGKPGDRMAQELNLTPQQQEQIRQIRESARQQMQSVLTAEQRAQLEATRQQGRRPQRPNLTEQQRQQMQQIRESTKQKIDAVLTPEQRARAEQLRQEHQERRQQRRGNSFLVR